MSKHLWDDAHESTMRARFAAMNDEIANSTFVPLEGANPELDGRCRATFVSEFAEELNLTDELRPQVSAAVRLFVATGWARVAFGDYAGGTTSWDGTEDALLDIVALDARNQAYSYKEERGKYGVNRWG